MFLTRYFFLLFHLLYSGNWKGSPVIQSGCSSLKCLRILWGNINQETTHSNTSQLPSEGQGSLWGCSRLSQVTRELLPMPPMTTTASAGVSLVGSEKVEQMFHAIHAMSQESCPGLLKTALQSTDFFVIHRYIFWCSDGFSCPSPCWPPGGQKQQAQIWLFHSFLQAPRAIFMESQVVCIVWSFLLIILCYAFTSSLQALIPCLFSDLSVTCS